MPRSRPNNNIRLPQSLLDQLDDTPDTVSRHRRSRAHPQKNNASRRETRKQDREEKKRRKAQYFSSTATHPERVATSPHPESPPHKRRRVAETSRSQLPVPNPGDRLSETSSGLVSKKPTKGVSLHKAASNRPRDHPDASTLPRSQQEAEEDRYIALLEARLNSGKTSRQRTGYIKDIDEDGLGDLLDDLDAITTHPDQFSNDPFPLSETGLVPSDQNEHEVCSDDEHEPRELEEWHGIHDTTLEMAALGAESQTNPLSDHQQLPVGSPTAGSSRYVPPHLREGLPNPNKSDSYAKLTRQLKGSLNKLSEQNIATILSSIEALYREHRRNDVTTSITSFVIEVVSAHSALLDSYVILHAALVSSLHRIIGAEFAASFVQSVVSSYEHHYSVLASATVGDALSDPSGKECSNLIVLLSELYNFQVISCVLVYDIIRNLLLAVELTEYVVELLLKLLRNSGQQLRQDDPSALKDIVQIVQSKTSDTETPLSSRTRFMLETLINLKNNKTKRAATQHAGGDVTERLKKFLTGLSKTRHLVAHEPLRVSLDDLHSADTRGKWWLVGAAWSGDPLVERQESSKRALNTRDEDVAENALVKLAKKQGMNTDVRRSIFVVLMSSEDYVDACERLAQLNLTEVQQRDVIRVLVSCCGNEKSYNPYYAFVGQHLCRTSHSYKITLQFCLWDFLRGIGESSVGGAEVVKNLKGGEDDFEVKDVSSTKTNNVANAYAWWVAKGCVALSVFKPVDFTVLKPRTRDFLSHFFRQLFAYSQSSIPTLQSDVPPTRNKASLEEIFVKAARIQVLAMGLVYFLTEMKKGSEEEFIRWAIGVAIDALRTGLDIVPAL
ncbi:hypothetical protein EDB84DRAFT_1634669 [Lactarius hengduanensis]|nr:hypothetical protein EDB84DRAFT_1634669 [Lactarius hengduanensis]